MKIFILLALLSCAAMSPPTSTVSTTTGTAPAAPPTPVNFSATTNGVSDVNTMIVLRWQPGIPSPGANGPTTFYRVGLSTNNVTPLPTFMDISTNSMTVINGVITFTIPNRLPGTAYFVNVAAGNPN